MAISGTARPSRVASATLAAFSTTAARGLLLKSLPPEGEDAADAVADPRLPSTTKPSTSESDEASRRPLLAAKSRTTTTAAATDSKRSAASSFASLDALVAGALEQVGISTEEGKVGTTPPEIAIDEAKQTIRVSFPNATATGPSAGRGPERTSSLLEKNKRLNLAAKRTEQQEALFRESKMQLDEYQLQPGEIYCPRPENFGIDDDPANGVFYDGPEYYPDNVKAVSSAEVAIYEDGLTGWTINAKGRVSSKFAVDLTGGYMEFKYDASGVTSNAINANFYACAQSKDLMNGLTETSTGEDVKRTYCDAQPSTADKGLGGSCEEFDLWESSGQEGGRITMHRAFDGSGQDMRDFEQPEPNAVFRWSQFDDGGGKMEVGTQSHDMPANFRGVNVRDIGRDRGWRIHSSQWTGWTPKAGNRMDHDALARPSVYRIRGFRGSWTWIAGTKPPKCDANGKVPQPGGGAGAANGATSGDATGVQLGGGASVNGVANSATVLGATSGQGGVASLQAGAGQQAMLGASNVVNGAQPYVMNNGQFAARPADDQCCGGNQGQAALPPSVAAGQPLASSLAGQPLATSQQAAVAQSQPVTGTGGQGVAGVQGGLAGAQGGLAGVQAGLAGGLQGLAGAQGMGAQGLAGAQGMGAQGVAGSQGMAAQGLAGAQGVGTQAGQQGGAAQLAR
ncbi:unnamed protein product [Amoebophrya sp. A120]|nr:unnamed protein product [Amoebophrya sp. A120]|eukprot:GSA120T00009425001.1